MVSRDFLLGERAISIPSDEVRFDLGHSLNTWFAALEARHLADLTWPEVTRALRALSSAYVQRRGRLAEGAALDGRGKRAAFALFYGPLHFATVASVLLALRDDGEDVTPADAMLDAGCGTGAGGAAWALMREPHATVLGVDINAWAVTETAWTYRHFGLRGTSRRIDAARARVDAGQSLVAAYTLNELDAPARQRLLDAAIAARGGLLVVEPISRAITPWWSDAAAAVVAAGGRADDWKLPLVMPERWRLLDRGAGFRRDALTARSLWIPPR